MRTAEQPAQGHPLRARLLALFPPLLWLRGYSLQWLRADLVAGITLAAYAVPVALAYATLAGLPPQVETIRS